MFFFLYSKFIQKIIRDCDNVRTIKESPRTVSNLEDKFRDPPKITQCLHAERGGGAHKDNGHTSDASAAAAVAMATQREA